MPEDGFSGRWLHVRRAAVGLLAAGVFFGGVGQAHAVTASVDLRSAESYSVLSGSGVTSNGPTAMSEGLGSVPPGSLGGDTPPIVLGETNVGNAAAATAKGDLDLAFGDAKTRTPTGLAPAGLGGLTFNSGVHNASGVAAMGASEVVTLDGQDDPNAVFIFQIGGALTLGASSQVKLVNEAQACNVFWVLDGAATFGASVNFAGTLMSDVAVTLGATNRVDGRVMARSGLITMAGTAIHTAKCPGVVLTGPPGPAGPAGEDGDTGPAGPAGSTGATGPTGAAGTDGTAGEDGTAGKDGTDGTDGAQGEQGEGVLTEFVPVGDFNCLAGGVRLVSGADVTYVCNGFMGAQGALGATGAPGATGPTGAAGRNGLAGARGADGGPGATGPAGVDAPAALPTVLCVSSRPQRATARRGRRMTWTVSVTNCGGRPADNVRVALRLGTGFSLKRAPGSSVSGGVLSWTRGSLAPGATASYRMTLGLGRTMRRGAQAVTVSAEGDNAREASGTGTTRVTG